MYIAMYTGRMAKMIRKQIYIEARQERLLKRRAKELGVTESELIREGIDNVQAATNKALAREQALKEHRAFIRERMKLRVPQTGRGWTREELYEERIARLSR